MRLTKEEEEKAFDYIIDSISNRHRSLVKSFDGKIGRGKFYRMISKDKSKRDRYVRACEDRQEYLFDEIIDISDEAHGDIKTTEDGKEYVDHEAIQRSRLRVDARKWALSKMNPKKYGDKIDHTTDGEKMENNITISPKQWE